jgi:hypothetical protein
MTKEEETEKDYRGKECEDNRTELERIRRNKIWKTFRAAQFLQLHYNYDQSKGGKQQNKYKVSRYTHKGGTDTVPCHAK